MKTTAQLIVAFALALAAIILPIQAGPVGEARVVNCKTETVGIFENGKDWEKALPPQRVIRTEAEFKAFYKALGKEPSITVDFATELLCVVGKPTWNENSIVYRARVDAKGDLILIPLTTKAHYRPPKKGPYYTELSLVRVPSKGIKSYEGKPLE